MGKATVEKSLGEDVPGKAASPGTLALPDTTLGDGMAECTGLWPFPWGKCRVSFSLVGLSMAAAGHMSLFSNLRVRGARAGLTEMLTQHV